MRRREQWLEHAAAAVADAEIVVLDPDNGLLPPSARMYGLRGPKYATLDECRRFADGGRRSLVVYQHVHRRGTAEAQAREQLRRLAEAVGVAPTRYFALLFHRGTARAYLVAPAAVHAALLRRRAEALVAGPWGQEGHFSLVR